MVGVKKGVVNEPLSTGFRCNRLGMRYIIYMRAIVCYLWRGLMGIKAKTVYNASPLHALSGEHALCGLKSSFVRVVGY